MVSYKLVAIDLDDTLLRDDLTVSPRVRRALRDIRDRGILITLATGRMYRSALPFARQLDLEVPLITYQGALVKDSVKGETLCHFPVPLEEAREIILLIKKEYGFHLNVYIDDNLYVEGITEEGEGYAKLAGVPLNMVGDFQDFLDREPTKLLVIGPEQGLDHLAERLKSIYQGRLHITKSKPHFLEIMDIRADKGRALARVAQIYEIPREKIMAFGDSYNDLEMLSYAGAGVVMGNARKEIKRAADYITLSNNEDGVAVALEKLILNP